MQMQVAVQSKHPSSKYKEDLSLTIKPVTTEQQTFSWVRNNAKIKWHKLKQSIFFCLIHTAIQSYFYAFFSILLGQFP